MSNSAIPSDIGRRTAPELYGMFFNCMLMGSLTVQIYQYYICFPKDRQMTKAIVYGIFLLELTQSGIMYYFAYTIFGTGYGNLATFDKSALEWFPVCILGSLIAGIVQMFYANRVYTFSRSKPAYAIISVFALLQIGSGIGQGVISKLVTDRSNLASKPICVTVSQDVEITFAAVDIAVISKIWLVSSAVCDLTIAGCMTFYLKRQRVLSIHTSKVITKLVRYTIETGAVTALVAIVQVVVFLASPKDNFFETPSWTLGKLYSNSLLVLLNARAEIVGGRNKESEAASDGFYINEIQLRSRGGIIAAPMHHISAGSATTTRTATNTTEHIIENGRKIKKIGSQGALNVHDSENT
ncbi:hypothetical protein D9757_001526 [Collybiopsis confluens]|uniref:DUF6534 domain-containing protein n=1 Tax=Collybiopsis confluens TaxID=2823264 RepID=A0A8H5HZB0_9AGAR|nr:hypothetical protein D9757_001526 [Collybiopsis confluens]